jgi:hypothetical protein
MKSLPTNPEHDAPVTRQAVLVTEGGAPGGATTAREPFRALDDLMAVVEALCPSWPRREVRCVICASDACRTRLASRTAGEADPIPSHVERELRACPECVIRACGSSARQTLSMVKWDEAIMFIHSRNPPRLLYRSTIRATTN